ncbi:hypothetical protein [Bradyrhizobium sp. 2S1]|uniref:hypothetical protein n=1 Tax=Bradyrhizobium sp. 2S1 TaxID=1404429 RepID=UPI00140A511C|nr:hypothetical protein [Bradyrhizobium sp. 2S1]MCK7667935.1 hypothetical protein [Bradyrhizobium sp. 2S1]
MKRTVAPHGITGAELRRLSGAVHQMRKTGGELWWVSAPKGSTRDGIAAVLKRISRLQSDQGLPKYATSVFETRPAFHVHAIFVGNSSVAADLNRSAVCRGCHIARVTDADGLTKKYLAKERTPQAGTAALTLAGVSAARTALRAVAIASAFLATSSGMLSPLV